jgi:predicted ABC-type sugar transport system permease subunit
MTSNASESIPNAAQRLHRARSIASLSITGADATSCPPLAAAEASERTASFRPSQAAPELSAVLLGGVAFSGGRGNLLGVFAGVLFIGVLNNGLLLFGVQPFWFRVSAGAALVVAAGLDAITRRIEDKKAGVG